MNFFFHHVGEQGSARDFPRTVFSSVPISRIAAAIPVAIPQREEILDGLRKNFPNGSCNVWGVPQGAKPVLNSLEVGDAMLLVGSVHWMSAVVPALAIVRFFPRVLLLDLSQELWGEKRFPYVFFFDTERVNHHWHQFSVDVEFKQNFNPRGQVYRVASERLQKFGGPLGYVDYIRENYK